MRYFKIEGILEVDDSVFNKETQGELLDTVTLSITETLSADVNGTFGGGIKEVDSEGNDI